MLINKMATNRHATSFINHNMFICIFVSLLLPMANEGAMKVYGDPRSFPNDDGGKRLTREYNLRQGALRGLIVKPSRQYDLQFVEMFLGIPYAAPPTGSFRFMPPASALPWPGVRMATRFAPVCPQSFPLIKKGNPPSLGRQNYMKQLKTFLTNESEDCLYLNIYVPYREQKSKKFPILVFMHGDSFEWSSGNSYDGRMLASYGDIMVITINFRLGILGFVKPSLTEHDYGNNGLLDQLAALQWIKDNIEDLNGNPAAVTVMGHGTGAACVNFLMLSPISNGLFHRAILMSGSALSDWAMTKDPTPYTLQVAQSLGCNPNSKYMMTCLQRKPLSEIKKVQILAREFETPLGPVVAGSFIPSEPAKTMEAYPNLLNKYQLLTGVTELERYHDFGVIELEHGILENQRDEFIKKYTRIIFEGAEKEALKAILKEYSPSKLDPQRWNVETNRDVILNMFSDARTLAPVIRLADYHSKTNKQSYFYVFGHNSISFDYAAINKSVHGEELPYIFGVPLGNMNTHFYTDYTQQEKVLSEVMMRMWTNFVKYGTPNTQAPNKFLSVDKRQWHTYDLDWPKYNSVDQSFLKIDIPPSVSRQHRSNYSKFWIDTLPSRMSRYIVDPLFEFTPSPAPAIPPPVQKPKSTHRNTDPIRRIWTPKVMETPHYSSSIYGKMHPYSQPVQRPNTNDIYREIMSIEKPSKPVPPELLEKTTVYTTTAKPKVIMPVKISSATITLIVSLSIVFLAINIGICSILYFKKRKLRLRERTLESARQPRAEIGEVDVIGQKSSKEDKSALQTLKNGCSVIKSMSFNKMKNNSKKHKKKSDPCKTPKSDDSGGFRERFQLRRHLSTSTLDAHTKVRDWIANEVMHRCSPGILRKSNSDLNNDKHMSLVKPFTRSEELLSDTKRSKRDTLKINDSVNSKSFASKTNSKTKTSEKTTSTSALGSHSSIASNKQSSNSIKPTSKSSESIKSKATESIKSKKVSVAIDATPAARTNSILTQEPIEISKSFDAGNQTHSTNIKLQRTKTEGDTPNDSDVKLDNKTYTNIVTLSVHDKPLIISHKHSSSDPITDVNYDKMLEKMECSNVVDILPPITFRNDINVTSREDKQQTQPMTAEEALLHIRKRNFPKVLPDLPKAQKRLSLQPTALQTFRSYSTSTESQDRKVPPQPPPRTTTLERRLAYKNTKILSSFNTFDTKNINENDNSKNYENIDSLTPYFETSPSYNMSFDKKQEPKVIIVAKERDLPKVIIASSDASSLADPKIVITPTPSQVDIPTNAPRVRLPDDFHSQAGSVTSFTSFCSDYDDEEIDDDLMDIEEDKLLQELVGGVESPTDMVEILDSKGPETIFEKKLEIVPVKINPGHIAPKSSEDYVCISDLLLPDLSGLEKTAQIKPNFGLNKLQHRTESIHKPPEKAVKIKQRRSIKTPSILNRGSKGKRGSDRSRDDSMKLEHSNSGSSNDTETSTGTVKKVELKK